MIQELNGRLGMIRKSTETKKRQREAAAERLRREWDERLKPLHDPDAGRRLRQAFDDDCQLNGEVRVGPGR